MLLLETESLKIEMNNSGNMKLIVYIMENWFWMMAHSKPVPTSLSLYSIKEQLLSILTYQKYRHTNSSLSLLNIISMEISNMICYMVIFYYAISYFQYHCLVSQLDWHIVNMSC